MNYFYELAKRAASGHSPDKKEIERILCLPYTETISLLPGTDLIRQTYFGRKVSLCTITNAKSGKCSEDCSFCAQSAHHGCVVDEYPLKKAGELAETGKALRGSGINRFSMVTSGKGLSSHEIQTVGRAVRDLNASGIRTCASLGVLKSVDLDYLKQSGLERYHHNLETAPSLFPRICTTHDFAQRVDTVAYARRAGLSVCSGGVFGIGETDAQVAELAMVLKDLDVDAVPVNFLIPIPGTPLENVPGLTPLRCLKIISILRFLLPDKEIIVCGGRMQNLRDLHPLIFMAGASGIMTGNYLTREGRSLEEDLRLIRDMGLEPA
ncbi:biotin synthase BioB [Desulfonatronovibrio hydrogenovorans]|uniref:biotin synthase BioB n=1 Tax=Desulfonatronovibrio hydrogenovorans TaxID=53245 RepID=UPI00048AC6CE|nr:biotin synthase BioB [Desulfonatronovibrio hydrogenovorans]